MKHIYKIILTSVFFVIVSSSALLTSCEKSGKAPIPKTESMRDVPLKSSSNIISYEILRKWTPQGGGIGMALLVPEVSTKEEILALARNLRAAHLSKRWIWIDIFDSEEAFQHRDDPKYPEAKYFKHWLAQVSYNKATGYDKIEWVAEGRSH